MESAGGNSSTPVYLAIVKVKNSFGILNPLVVLVSRGNPKERIWPSFQNALIFLFEKIWYLFEDLKSKTETNNHCMTLTATANHDSFL